VIALFANQYSLTVRDRGVAIYDGAVSLGCPNVKGETRNFGVGRPDPGHSLLRR
jgi:hypothetical protein